MKNHIYYALAFLGMCGLSTPAISASDGLLGVSSTGTTTISISLGELYQVTGFSDFPMGTYTGTGDVVSSDTLCVFTNGSSTTYQVTISDDDELASFDLDTAGLTDEIPFSVWWDNTDDGSTKALVTASTTISNLSNISTTVSCGGADNAFMEFSISESDLQVAPPGAYSEILTIVVEASS